MAEDVLLCKRGHPRTPENVGRNRNCKTCEQIRSSTRDRSAYAHSEAGRASKRRYAATIRNWESQRRYELKGARQAILEQLVALEREERRCLQTLSECQTQMRSS